MRNVHLGLGSAELFHFTFIFSVWVSVSLAFGVCSALRGRPLLVVFKLSLWVACRTPRKEEPFLRLLCSHCVLKSQHKLDFLAGESDSALWSRGVTRLVLTGPLSQNNMHMMPDAALVLTCVRWVWFCDPDNRTGESCGINFGCLTCSDSESYNTSPRWLHLRHGSWFTHHLEYQ